MSVTVALQEWKHVANASVDVGQFRKQLAQAERSYALARQAFEETLDELEDDERDAILAVMTLYEQKHALRGRDDGQEKMLEWLLNKVGNEGSAGIVLAEVLTAWEAHCPSVSPSYLYAAFSQHADLFSRSNDGAQGVVKLTAAGQKRFLKGQ